MVKGIGVDIIDIDRIKRLVDGGASFVERVFSGDEIEYCRCRNGSEKHYAARFAAKEAFFKALGTGWRNGMKWTEVSVQNDSLGKPELCLSGQALALFQEKGFATTHLSLSHAADYAAAFVVLEG